MDLAAHVTASAPDRPQRSAGALHPELFHARLQGRRLERQQLGSAARVLRHVREALEA